MFERACLQLNLNRCVFSFLFATNFRTTFQTTCVLDNFLGSSSFLPSLAGFPPDSLLWVGSPKVGPKSGLSRDCEVASGRCKAAVGGGCGGGGG